MSAVRIPFNRAHIKAFCQKWKIARMAFFGSVLNERFGPESDVDILVLFKPDAQWSLFDIVEMKIELEKIFQRNVDIVEEGTIRNPIKRRCIYENLEVVYDSDG
jgi:uncharacterized protein